MKTLFYKLPISCIDMEKSLFVVERQTATTHNSRKVLLFIHQFSFLHYFFLFSELFSASPEICYEAQSPLLKQFNHFLNE